MLKEIKIFEAAEFFMVRIAQTPYSHYHVSLNSEDLLNFYKANPQFQEAIAIASPSLHQTLKFFSFFNLKNKKDRNAYFSLLKYFIRSSTRCTPFGLFSSIGWGQFSNKSTLLFQSENILKRVSLDKEWLANLIHTFNDFPELIRSLSIMAHPLLQKNGSRYYLRRININNQKKELISIRRSKVSDLIIELTKKPIPFKKLESALKEAHPKANPKKIEEYLWSMFLKEFLISELHPSSNHLNRPSDICKLIENQLKNIKIYHDLLSLEELLKKYENAESAEAIKLLELINSFNSKENKTTSVIQIDAYQTSEIKINRSIKEELEEAMALCILTYFSSEKNDHLDKFHLEFLEKYGNYRLVMLKELTDAATGLGFPSPKNTSISPEKGYLDPVSLFIQLHQNTHQDEIVIDELRSILPTLTDEQTEKLPTSLEIFFELATSSENTTDNQKYKILINPLVGSAQAGSSFGRFMYGFDISKKTELTHFIKKEENLQPKVCFVEAHFHPETPRTANVAKNVPLRKTKLQLTFHYPDAQTLPLEDIFVGATLDRLYLFSKRLNKEIRITVSNATNPDLFPPLLKLMVDISESAQFPLRSLFFDQQQNQFYFPRIRYKNVILSPKKWSIPLNKVKKHERETKKNIAEALKRLLNKHKIPDLVYYTQYDQKLLINWQNPNHFELILLQLINEEKLLLLECISPNLRPLKSTEEIHFCEFVLPFRKTKEHKDQNILTFFPNPTPIPLQERIIFPGGEWLYTQLHLPYEEDQSFLIREIAPFIQSLKDSRLIDKWFYIRYFENKKQIRLRLYGNKNILNEKVLSFLHEWGKEQINSGSLSSFSLHPYEKEIERYGGPKNIGIMEDFFNLDSDFCLELLTLYHRNYKHLSLPLFCSFSIIALISCFKIEHSEILRILAPQGKLEGDFSGQRPMLKELTLYTSALFTKSSYLATISDFISLIFNLFSKHITSFDNIISRFDFEECDRWTNQQELINSLIHMHCNRLMGIDSELEKSARAFAYLGVKKISHLATEKK